MTLYLLATLSIISSALTWMHLGGRWGESVGSRTAKTLIFGATCIYPLLGFGFFLADELRARRRRAAQARARKYLGGAGVRS